MRGKLNRWNDGRGFGFISPEGGGPDVFVHVSALKNMARRPLVGDEITFELDLDNKGKKRAVNASIVGVSSIRADTKKPRKKRIEQSRGIFGKLFTVIFVLGAGAAVISMLGEKTISMPNASGPLGWSSMERAERANFSCAGKTRCAEMSSCKEALFYLTNCPGVKIDGDGDGVPCEDQWCGR
ncbi:MAG: cold shock domain-containing protein [Chromatiaceae bacterium]|nr:cold shock domain-containing protein [Chromatiaceae bacterium]